MSSPDKLVLEITRRCPLECRHCSSESSWTELEQLEQADVFSAIVEAKSLGFSRVIFSGGEPFLSSDLPAFVEKARTCGLGVTVYTSGCTKADGEVEAVPGDAIRSLGDDVHYYLSIHSSDPNVHDEFVGARGAWKAAQGFLEQVPREAVDVHCVLTHLNYFDVEKLALDLDDRGIRVLRLLRLVPQGRAAGRLRELDPTPGDWHSVKKQLESLRKNRSHLLPNGLAVRLGAHLRLLDGSEFRCNLDGNKLLVQPNGRLSVCPALKHAQFPGHATPLYPTTKLREVRDVPWRMHVKNMTARAEEDCPAQQHYRSSLPPEETLGPIGRLTDVRLISCLARQVGFLGYPSDQRAALERQIKKLMSAAEEEGEEFSLFMYSSRAEREGLPSIFEIWSTVLAGATAVLKQHDLRENPARWNPGEPDFATSRPDIQALCDYYHEAKKFEQMLYGMDAWYRDHFAHALRVWMLGTVVALANAENLHYPEVVKDAGTNERLFTREEFLAAYAIAALCHDLGYPLEKAEGVNRQFAGIVEKSGGIDWTPLRMGLSPERHESAERLLQFLSSTVQLTREGGEIGPDAVGGLIRDRVDGYHGIRDHDGMSQKHREGGWGGSLRDQRSYFLKFEDALERRSHGLISALIFARLSLYFKEGEYASAPGHSMTLEEARQYVVRRDILRAIAAHSTSEIYPLHLLDLTGLLLFCDEIQDWGRPRFTDLYRGDANPQRPAVQLRSFDRDALEWEIEGGELASREAAGWLIHLSVNLYKRLRTAPDTPLREFKVSATLIWRDQGAVRRAVVRCGSGAERAREAFRVEVAGDHGRAAIVWPQIGRILSGKKPAEIQWELGEVLRGI